MTYNRATKQLELSCDATISPVKYGEICGYNMIYDSSGTCKSCSDVIRGCKICTNKNECVECEDSSKNPLPIIDSYGDKNLVCSAGIKVFD